jgi:hypothetical protein
VLLEYMASIRGAMREQTLQEAQQRRDKAAQWQVEGSLLIRYILRMGIRILIRYYLLLILHPF